MKSSAPGGKRLTSDRLGRVDRRRQRTFPAAAPWRLKGDAVLRLQSLPARLAEAPPALRTVRVSPGRTLGGLYAARYGQGSTLCYHELIVFSAVVRKGVRPGFRVSHIYVDNPLSAVGGRGIWGLPKELATFQWTSGRSFLEIAVAQSGALLCRLRLPKARHRVRLPIAAPVWSNRDSRLFRFKVTGSARVALAQGKLVVPPSSPLAGLGLRGGRMVGFTDLDVRVPAG